MWFTLLILLSIKIGLKLNRKRAKTFDRIQKLLSKLQLLSILKVNSLFTLILSKCAIYLEYRAG